MTKCKRFDICYFPKDVFSKKDYIGLKEVDKYIASCNFEGLDCEIEKLTDEEFKLFERKNGKGN